MPFHSPDFFALCLVTFLIYFWGGERWQHVVLLVSSLAFYAYAGATDTLVLLSAVLGNYLLAPRVNRGGPGGRKVLVLAIVFDVGLLSWFKYRFMVASWLNRLLSAQLSVSEVVIPLGISFYLFQLIAYQVDLYRGRAKLEPSFWRLLLYILFFPHHQAGPIMRPATFLPQFYGAKSLDLGLAGTGLRYIAWGLLKKLAADQVASSVDAGFALASSVGSAAEAWSLALRYGFQIYGDFSGYSDIAVGLGLLFGYRLDRNFHQPYLATDPSEFWRRWHVTLSAWLRDYLYIPLGGNRRGALRTEANLMATMLLGGLWHGASLRFALWGALHGLLLVVHRQVPAVFRFAPAGWMLTFGVTMVAWVPFRAHSWADCVSLISALFGGRGAGSAGEWGVTLAWLALIQLSHKLEDLVMRSPETRSAAERGWLRIPPAARGVLLGLVAVVVLLFVSDGTSYIYFRF